MPDARVETRFDLIEYLRRTGSVDAVHAELLRLTVDVPPGRTSFRRRIAGMLLDIGATDEAVENLREAADAAPRDVNVLIDLADAEVGAGLWSAARVTLRRAFALEQREGLRSRLALVERVLVLDPTRPRLRLSERTRRARRVLADVIARTESCAGSDASQLRDEAQRHISRGGDVDAQAAERDLDLAARIWTLSPDCHVDTTEARALTEVLRRVGMAEDAPP